MLGKNFLVLSSTYKNAGTNGEGSIYLKEVISGNFRLASFHINENLYNVTSYNNTFEWDGADYTLTPGVYTGSTLAAEIQTQITGTLANFVCTYNDTTKKLTLINSPPDGVPHLSFVGHNSHDVLGFPKNYAQALTSLDVDQTSTYPIDVTGEKHLYIKFNEADSYNILGNSVLNASLFIKKDNANGYHFTEDNCNQIIKFMNNKKLEYKFVNVNGQVIDPMVNWEIILEKV